MIGNDIVDLALARKESNWRRKGFLNKIFTVHEQQLIRTAVDPDQMVWLLWSMKESAYKIAVRRSGKRRFAPIQLACNLTEWTHHRAEGTICYEAKEYQIKSLLTAKYIATVCADKYILPNSKCGQSYPHISGQECPLYSSALSTYHLLFDHIIVPLKATAYPQQPTILWEKIKQYCSAAMSIPEEEIYFYKDEAGAPWMTLSSEEKVPLSVSHHGRFGAFVISSSQTYSGPPLRSIVHSFQDCGLKDCGLKTITPYLAP